MADGVTLQTTPATPPAGTEIATDELAGGEHVQFVKLMSGTLNSEEKIGGDAANGLDVDVVRLPALPAGDNNIGNVDVASSALPAGASTEATLSTRLSESDFDTKTGALTETAPASDTASSGLNGRLQRVAQRLTSLIGLLPTSLDANGYLRVGAGGYAKKPSITLTRGANTTAYTIGDEVATASTAPTAITVARVNAGTGFIVGGRIVYSNAPAVTPDLAILLFSETVTLAGDNAQLNLSDADAARVLGVLYTQRALAGAYSAGAPSTAGSLIMGLAPVAPIAFEAVGGTATLFVAVVTLNAFTPIAASETLLVCLDVDRD